MGSTGRTAIVMLALLAVSAAHGRQRYDVIDMHFHADLPDAEGPPGGKICAPYTTWAPRDPGQPIDRYLDWFTVHPTCPHALIAPTDAAVLRDKGIEILSRYNVLALAGAKQPPSKIIVPMHLTAFCPRRVSASAAIFPRSRHFVGCMLTESCSR